MSEILQCFAGCYFQVSTLICNKKLRTVYIRMNFIVIIAVVQPGTMGIQTPHYFDLPCELTLWGSKHPKDSYPTTLVYLVIGLWTDTVWGSKHPKDSHHTTLVYLVIGLWTDTVGSKHPKDSHPTTLVHLVIGLWTAQLAYSGHEIRDIRIQVVFQWFTVYAVICKALQYSAVTSYQRNITHLRMQHWNHLTTGQPLYWASLLTWLQGAQPMDDKEGVSEWVSV